MSRLIDADALIEFCAERWIPLNIDAVNMQPTIEPEPQEGRWIRVAGMNECCSACNKYFPLSYFTGRPFDINYCPHCGAKMKGAQNG